MREVTAAAVRASSKCMSTSGSTVAGQQHHYLCCSSVCGHGSSDDSHNQLRFANLKPGSVRYITESHLDATGPVPHTFREGIVAAGVALLMGWCLSALLDRLLN